MFAAEVWIYRVVNPVDSAFAEKRFALYFSNVGHPASNLVAVIKIIVVKGFIYPQSAYE
jgi:hypothetical protein